MHNQLVNPGLFNCASVSCSGIDLLKSTSSTILNLHALINLSLPCPIIVHRIVIHNWHKPRKAFQHHVNGEHSECVQSHLTICSCWKETKSYTTFHKQFCYIHQLFFSWKMFWRGRLARDTFCKQLYFLSTDKKRMLICIIATMFYPK